MKSDSKISENFPRDEEDSYRGKKLALAEQFSEGEITEGEFIKKDSALDRNFGQREHQRFTGGKEK
jgi:hypothetical protein